MMRAKEEETPNFPFEIKPLDAQLNEKLCKDFAGERTGFVQVGSKKWFYLSGYSTKIAHYYNFQVRLDDVFTVTFPRSGTTWVQEMVWLLANDLNYDKAEKIYLSERFPYLEVEAVIHPEVESELISKNICDDPAKFQMLIRNKALNWKELGEITERRFIKTHLPFSLLPQNLLKIGCKVIYVARNPKDVAVSFYHFSRLAKVLEYVGDFPKFWDYFEKNLVPWTPYWEHIKEGWENRNNENVLFLFYENINKNLQDTIPQIAAFLGKDYTNDQIQRLAEHLKIENFRKNKSVNFADLEILGVYRSGEEKFIRKGKTGGWKDYFDEELNARADDWIAKNLQNIPGFSFPDTTK